MKKIVLGTTIADVEWEDAYSNSEYWTLDEIAKEPPFVCHVTGYIIRNDKQRITLARERMNKQAGSKDVRFRDVMSVPRGMVRKVTILNG